MLPSGMHLHSFLHGPGSSLGAAQPQCTAKAQQGKQGPGLPSPSLGLAAASSAGGTGLLGEKGCPSTASLRRSFEPQPQGCKPPGWAPAVAAPQLTEKTINSINH